MEFACQLHQQLSACQLARPLADKSAALEFACQLHADLSSLPGLTMNTGGDPHDSRNWSAADGNKLRRLMSDDPHHSRKMGFGQWAELTYGNALLWHPQYAAWAMGQAKTDCGVMLRSWATWLSRYVELIEDPSRRLQLREQPLPPQTQDSATAPSDEASSSSATDPRELVNFARALVRAPPVAILEARLLAMQDNDDDPKVMNLLWSLDCP